MTARGIKDESAVRATRPPFRVPKFRTWPSGKAATMPSYGQHFSIHPDGNEFVLHHRPFYVYVLETKLPDCLARFDTMADAQAAAIEIARMAYEDRDAFPKPAWLIEREARQQEEWARYRAAHTTKPVAGAILYPDNPERTASAIAFLVEAFGAEIAGKPLSDAARYQLAIARAALQRLLGLAAAPNRSEGGNVVTLFPEPPA